MRSFRCRLDTSQPLNRLEAQLETLRAERADLAATRTREDTRKLAEDWLAAACSRMNGMAGLVLNGHANPPRSSPSSRSSSSTHRTCSPSSPRRSKRPPT
jgi:hypothetical protein